MSSAAEDELELGGTDEGGIRRKCRGVGGERRWRWYGMVRVAPTVGWSRQTVLVVAVLMFLPSTRAPRACQGAHHPIKCGRRLQLGQERCITAGQSRHPTPDASCRPSRPILCP